MQDELNSKVVAIVIRGGEKTARVTADVLKAAMREYLAKERQRSAARSAGKSGQGVQHGKQTVKQLMKQEQGLTNIEVTDKNIKSFERTANKYNIDFALKKDMTSEKPKYIVFFKARDVDVMTAAFKEYSAKTIERSKKPSVRKQLSKAKNLVRNKDLQREKDRSRDRERQL